MNNPICYQYYHKLLGGCFFTTPDIYKAIIGHKPVCYWRIKEHWKKAYSKRIIQMVGEESYKECLEIYNDTK